MATTLKRSTSPDSPQCEEQYVTHKISILQNFSKTYSIYNIVLQTIVRTALHFLTLDVTVPNTINTHEFHPASYLARNSKFHHNILWLLWHYKISLSTFTHFYMLFAHTAVQIVSFKNPPTNCCCFGTSTTSPWAKATFLYMYLF